MNSPSSRTHSIRLIMKSFLAEVSQSFLSILGVILFAFFALSAPSDAQTTKASVHGIVEDPSGAILSNALVVAHNIDTGANTTAKTNADGDYALQDLQVGHYTVTVELHGFERSVTQGIVLSTKQVLSLNVQLRIGEVAQTVTVTDDKPALDTRTSDVEQIIESKSVEDLPLGNRSAMNLVSLTAGAVFVDSADYSFSGGRTKSQMTWLDGGTGQNIRVGNASLEVTPPVDQVQELGIILNNYAAEYGATASGVIIQTTKSGTNAFHGSGYEYFRNDAMDAPGHFAPTVGNSKSNPALRYNIFGGTFGGPIRHNRTFFFFGYEGQRQDAGVTDTLTVPTLLQRQGDFSQTYNSAGKVIPIYNPATTTRVNGVNTRTQFAGNVIPQASWDKVGANLISYFPKPNVATTSITGANNFVANDLTHTNSDFYLAKVDHQLTDKDRLTARYIYTRSATGNDSVYPNKAADPYTYSLTHDNILYGAWTRLLGLAASNDLRFVFETRVNHQLEDGVGSGYVSKLGLSGVPGEAFPYFSASGYSPLGTTTQERRQYPIDQYQFVDNVNVILGRHTLKFGGELRRSMDHEVNLATGSGSFTFSTLPTGLPSNASTGNGFATLLLGFPTAFSEGQTSPLTRNSWYISGFAQDDFALTSKLVLNLGLRWETDTPIHDESNKMNGFDPLAINPVSNTPGVVKFMGLNGYRSGPYNADLNNFGPRLGFSWQPGTDDKTVVRGGFGVFFTHPFDTGAPTSASVGYSVSASLNTPDNGITAPFYLANGVPSTTPTHAALNDSFGAVAVGKTPTTSIDFYDPNHRAGYSYQYNLGIERQLPGSLVLSLSGVGNITHKLPATGRAINQIAPSVLSATQDTQAYRPFPQFSGVTIDSQNNGYSNYTAGLIRVKRSFSRGVSLETSYTFSKMLDNTSEGGASLGANNGPYSNYYNRLPDYGPSGNDVRHHFIFSSVYELPLGRGKKWLSHGPASYAMSGWTIGAVTALQSGAPFTVITQTNNTNAFSSGSQRANISGNPILPRGQRSVAKWFNTGAFSQPAQLTFGNESSGSVRGPSYLNSDFSLIRHINLGEKRVLQLRVEAFNSLNHTNLGLPGSTFGASTFGTITSANPARVIQVGSHFIF